MREQVLRNLERKYNKSKMVWEWIPTHPPAYSETDSGYSSERGSVRDPSERNYAPSDSDRSNDTPPYFKDEKKDDKITIASTQKIIEAAMKETLSSQVRVVVSLVVVAAVLYFACNYFSRETPVKHVNIVLQSSSGEETNAEVMEKLLNHLREQLKQEEKTRVHAKSQAERDKNQAAKLKAKPIVESQAEEMSAEVMEKLLNHLREQLKQEEKTRVHAESQAERDKNQAAELKAKPIVESQAEDTGHFYHLFAVCYGLVVIVAKLFHGFIVLLWCFGFCACYAQLFNLTRHSKQ